MPVELLLPLELLEAGEWAEVLEVSGDPASVHRLAEIGVRAGARVKMLQSGTPCLVQIGGAKLSLRNHWKTEVTVRPLGLAEPGL